jgi:BirA family biotin operon repressor/biotin-[acetyl-CoA-carboxylase] ligase
VLSLRVGLALADALAPLADGTVSLKWPNDVLAAGRKLAGVLVEARWRDARAEWVAVGVGLNVRPPAGYDGAGSLRAEVTRLDALPAVVGAVKRACGAAGPLGAGELAALDARDAVRGRTVLAPVAGVAAGVSAGGALLVRGAGRRAARGSADLGDVRRTPARLAADRAGAPRFGLRAGECEARRPRVGVR